MVGALNSNGGGGGGGCGTGWGLQIIAKIRGAFVLFIEASTKDVGTHLYLLGRGTHIDGVGVTLMYLLLHRNS